MFSPPSFIYSKKCLNIISHYDCQAIGIGQIHWEDWDEQCYSSQDPYIEYEIIESLNFWVTDSVLK